MRLLKLIHVLHFSLIEDNRIKLKIYSVKACSSVQTGAYALDRFSANCLVILLAITTSDSLKSLNYSKIATKVNCCIKAAFAQLYSQVNDVDVNSLRKVAMIFSLMLQQEVSFGSDLWVDKDYTQKVCYNLNKQLASNQATTNSLISLMSSTGSMHSFAAETGCHYLNSKQVIQSDSLIILNSSLYRNHILKRNDPCYGDSLKTFSDLSQVHKEYAIAMAEELYCSNECSLKEEDPMEFKTIYLQMLLSIFNRSNVINISAPCGTGKSMVPFFVANLLQKCIQENDTNRNPSCRPSVILLISSFINILDMYETSCNSESFPRALGNIKAVMFKNNPGVIGIFIIIILIK